MSKYEYRVYLNQLQYEQNIAAALSAALQAMNARRLTPNQTAALSKTKLRRSEKSAEARAHERRNDTTEAVSIPKELFEVRIPNDITKALGIADERILVTIDDKKMDILLTDASVPSAKCTQIVQNFVGDLYGRATGKKVDPEQIAITPFAILDRTICEHCLEPLEGLPYRCRVCGRCFCHTHRAPVTHGCAVEEKDAQTEIIIRTQQQRKTKSKREDKAKAVVVRIPCG